MAFLELAQTTDNDWLKQFVREGYDQAIRNGIVRMGWYPMWTRPVKYDRPASLLEVTEPCAVGDTVVLGVKLSDAGLGDYWDDVDSTIRNHLIAQQISDLETWCKISSVDLDSATGEMRKRYLGGFGCGGPSSIEWGYTPGCCTVNGAQAFYYAWHGITRFDDGVATVNLFLNRASEWMDIDSYLPFEGKVVLHNKKAHTAMVRIPRWVDTEKVTCKINSDPANPPLIGRYLLIANLDRGAEIVIEFPVEERSDKYMIAGTEYTLDFRGSTVVDISPRQTDPSKYPIYQREHLKREMAPMRKVKRFVASKVIPLGTF